MRKLRRATKAAEIAIETLAQLFTNFTQGHGRNRQFIVGRLRFQACKHVAESVALAAYLSTVLVEMGGNARQQFAERRHAIAALFREIRAAEERSLIVGAQEHRQRPTAAALR